MADMRRLWPGDVPGLSEAELTAAYAPVDRNRPWLRVNFVTSADGAVTLDGHSEGLSSAPDKRVFGLLRMLCDVLLVGAGTVREEGYRPLRLDPVRRAWRREAGLPEVPALAVISSRLALDPDDRMFADAPVRPIVITHGGSPLGARDRLTAVADVLVVGDAEVSLAAAREALAARGLRQVLCEGGPHLFGSLLAADQVDELCLTVAPLLAGPGAGRIVAGPGAPPRRFRLDQVLQGDGNLLLRYARRAPADT
ncbi:MAG: pyrimidine reductase family protein [Micromonosporaceae bacterium]